MTNQLSSEKSPYLKQHETNPVHWLPWNKETLKKAKDENLDADVFGPMRTSAFNLAVAVGG